MPKSTAPRKRKPQKKPKNDIPQTNPWDELQALHDKAVIMISEATRVSELYKNATVMRQVKDRPRFNTLGNILLQDMTQFNQRLQAIKDRHVHAPSDDDTDKAMLAISIGEMYTQWMADWAAVIPTTIAEILTLSQGATEEEVAAEKARALAGTANAFADQKYVAGKDPNAKPGQSAAPAPKTTAKPRADLMSMARGGTKKK